jgi:hypothetical protein
VILLIQDIQVCLATNLNHSHFNLLLAAVNNSPQPYGSLDNWASTKNWSHVTITYQSARTGKATSSKQTRDLEHYFTFYSKLYFSIFCCTSQTEKNLFLLQIAADWAEKIGEGFVADRTLFSALLHIASFSSLFLSRIVLADLVFVARLISQLGCVKCVVTFRAEYFFQLFLTLFPSQLSC